MRREATQGSSTNRWQHCLAWAARAVASTVVGLGTRLGRRGSRIEDDPFATTIAVPDGGSEESADAHDPEKTAFVWGQTREAPAQPEGQSQDHSDQSGGQPADTRNQPEEQSADTLDQPAEQTTDASVEREERTPDVTIQPDEQTQDSANRSGGQTQDSANRSGGQTQDIANRSGGQTTDAPDHHRRGSDGPPEPEFVAILDRLDVLAETADHLSILAMNANLKLARDETRDIPGIVYDVEADARSLRRAIEDVECRVDRLRRRFQGPRSDQPGTGGDGRVRDVEARGRVGGVDGRTHDDEVDGRDCEVRPHWGGRDGRTVGRTSTQLPAGDTQPSGPWRTAGVDLTNWPGDLARLDFEQVKEQVTRSETVTTGRVPPDVAEYSLDDREISFEALLSLSTASGLDAPTTDDVVTSDEED